MLYRYEIVALGENQNMNRLLLKGWRPVRETLLGANSPDATQQLLILLEKEGDALGNAVVNGVDVATVKGISLFEGLTPPELEEVLAACDVADYGPDDIVFSKGDESHGLYVVLSGEVVIRLAGQGEEEMEITEIGPESTFGESSFFSFSCHTGTAQCVQPTRILQLRRDAYGGLSAAGSSSSLKVAENAAESLASALRTSNDWILELLNEQATGESALSWQRFRNRIRHGHFG